MTEQALGIAIMGMYSNVLEGIKDIHTALGFVVKQMKKQSAFNKSTTLFIIGTTVCLHGINARIHAQEKKINDLKGEIEELKNVKEG